MSAPAVRAAAPLTAVDQVEMLSSTEAIGSKQITATDPYLAGHYPDMTIYPGVFVVESVRQTALRLLEENRPELCDAMLVRIPSVRFTTPFFPGDHLRVHARCRRAFREAGADAAAETDCSREVLEVDAKVTRINAEGVEQPAARVRLELGHQTRGRTLGEQEDRGA